MTETVNGPAGRRTAGEPTGLRIRRSFSTEGVHPYDEVTWERRDVVQTNWRTGDTVFEQRGVEFPDFWSVNASTIVTTKYFRGALGTEARETSLRQLVDRVVSTYRAAGEQHGYFATHADAEVFEHELTWLLVHQYFSFNSPVWFNVGTASPQQVSACQPYDAVVSTPAGPVPIGRLVEQDAVGTKVYDAHGVTSVVATKANGVKEVLRLHTKAGPALDVTADHLVWRTTGAGAGRFVHAGTLRPGDVLEWHRRDPDESQLVGIFEVEQLGAMEVYDIQTESGEYLSDGLRVHNCFILSVDDSMDSILNWYKEEGFIFKGGSGAGLNLSRIRSSKELLSSGGTASGPVSFMRGADASAGTIKSGGATRRAAKMVVLDVDHPDIEEFVETKAREEDKIRALRDAGFDMDLGGRDITSVQYQNANNSVRVSDEFMRAVENGTTFGLRARKTGEVVEEVDARALFRKISQAAWECADPGLQYDDTINDWHTNPETGRITASNPCCFTGETIVRTADGPTPLETLVASLRAGETAKVLSLVAASDDERLLAYVEVSRGWQAGETHDLVEVATARGLRLRSTPEHRYLADGHWVEAARLRVGQVLVSERGGSDVVTEVTARRLDQAVAVYDLEVPDSHNFVVGADDTPGVVVHNSEYMSLDNSSCNLASLNLLKFLRDDDTFDAERFARAVETVITAMDISICFADFPTEAIGRTTRDYRQLGIGYANLGALLMAMGLGYDSDGGRSMAAAITSLMTGRSYRRSAELAAVVGPYAGYARNAAAHRRVMRKHRAANDAVRTLHAADRDVHAAATKAWADVVKLGEEHGFRNAQASVLAPTGCLTGDTMVTTDRGLTRLRELGDVWGDRWQEIDVKVSTDEGARRASQFFVNGEEPTRRVVTRGGYTIQGTLAHRIKVVDRKTGEWVWRRMADLAPDEIVPLQLGTLVGEPRGVPLPVLDQAYYAGDRYTVVPDEVTPELAELVGYFMGDGSLHAKGIRLCVANEDLDVLERLRVLAKELFALEPVIAPRDGYREVTLSSVRLARWWRAAGFSKLMPHEDHSGKGWTPRVPSALLETNSTAVYAGFLRGLFEADGTVLEGVPSVTTASESFANELRTLMLALGLATTTRQGVGGWGGTTWQLRLRNVDHALRFDERVGFLGARKNGLVVALESPQSGNRDRIYLPRAVWDDLVPVGSRLRRVVVSSLAKSGGVSRRTAEAVYVETCDDRLAFALDHLFEPVAANKDGGVQPTYDLSVPDNVTYVAGGFTSHNTIGFMMDCDTTGIEPDFSLVKFKKLVGGGSLQIVNQTIPRALRKLGYPDEQVEAIVEYIADKGHVIDAPGLRPEHYEVFDTAMGARALAPMGHVRMMAACQPFLSGAISKCVTGETLLPTENGLVRIASLHRGEAADTFRAEVMEVAGPEGPQKTDAFYFGGLREVREVVLRSGHRVVGTHNHRVLAVTDGALEWKYLAELQAGDYVAQQYGTQMWSQLPARFDDFSPQAAHGSQKYVMVPTEMSEDLAFLLGAYASEGHTTRSTWTVSITNSDEEVLERVRLAWAAEFGVTAKVDRPSGKCPQVIVASKRVVEFLEYLGCGSRAREKRIPDAVLRSPREMVLAFLEGLSLDAYTTTGAQAKWAICLDAPALLDDLQAVLANLGVVHGRVSKYNPTYDKSYDEVYASGRHAQLVASLVPFPEKHKAERAAAMIQRSVSAGASDVVPCITGRELYQSIPASKGGRGGHSLRRGFTYLLDPQTKHPTFDSVARVAQLPGVVLPADAARVLADNLRFSPVVRVEDAGEREVYDVSVPTTHAFVGNGIVNHNTVNLPETATVEDIEDIYLQSWKLGLKATAVYRDNCKVGQPLADARSSTADQAVEAPAVETRIEYRPTRKRLPKSRPSRTTSFTVGGAEGYMTSGSYPDDGLGEVFLKLGKQGSTLAGVMDAFSIAVSIGLQYGVPLETYVSKFTNLRFEPAGLTDDPDVRMAQSIMDYIFRRLALDYLPFEDRAALGIYSAEERQRQLETGSYEAVEEEVVSEADSLRSTREPAAEPPHGEDPAGPVEAAAAKRAPGSAHTSAELLEVITGTSVDSPLCFTCGTKMRPAGSCFVCEGCGSTSGCS